MGTSHPRWPEMLLKPPAKLAQTLRVGLVTVIHVPEPNYVYTFGGNFTLGVGELRKRTTGARSLRSSLYD